MKKTLLFLVAALFAVQCSVASAEPAQLIINEQSSYSLVLPDKTAGSNVDVGLELASQMLVKAFQAASGTKLSVVKEKDFKGGKAVFLGNTAAIRALGVDLDKECDNYEYILREKDGNIFIAGRDFVQIWYESYKNYPKDIAWASLGTVKGAVAFAEEFLDVRFLLRGEVGTDYARHKGEVRIPAGMNRHVKPMLDFGTGRFPGHSLYDYSTNNLGDGSLSTYGGHSYYTAVPASKYFKKHPEYFAMLGGKRNASGNHLCISNKEVQELIYKEALRVLDKGANMVQVSQTDGYKACECDACKAFGNTNDPGEKLWIIHIGMAKRLLKDCPGKRLHLIAYEPTALPPTQFKEFPENVMVELCKYTPKFFEIWRKSVKVPGGFSCYLYNWGPYNMTGFTAKRTPQYASDQVRLFAANNVRGIYRCGCYENMGMEGPTYYVYGKMLDDPTQEWQNLANEFYSRAYKEAAAPMKAFFTEFYQRLEIFSAIQSVKNFYDDNRESCLPKDPKVILSAIYTPELLEKMESSLSTAEKLAKDPKVILRLKAVRFGFDYAKNLGNCIHLYYAFKTNPNQGNFEQLASELKKRNELVAWCYKPENKNYIPGWPEAIFTDLKRGGRLILQTNGRESAAITTPLTWDVDKMLKDKYWTLEKMSMDILPVKEPVPFDFSNPVWQAGKWYSLSSVDPKQDHFTTKTKFLYDDKNLYCAAETTLANTNFRDLGHDGPLWDQDCMEFFLDPTCSRNIYYHLIIAPIANCTYDEAAGLITDPLHPLYGKPDSGWNGNWSFQTKIADGKWYSLTTIPFSTLNTEKPVPGTEWLGNVAREGYMKDPFNFKGSNVSKPHPELSIWSPNQESSGFENASSFSKLIFK